MKNIKIATFIIVSFALLSLAAMASASDRAVSVHFDYAGNATAYRLYMDGGKVCEAQAKVEKVMDCTFSIPYGVHIFTMTAIEEGIETVHSNAYAWTYSPTNTSPPTMINFTITVDGQTQQVGPVPIQ